MHGDRDRIMVDGDMDVEAGILQPVAAAAHAGEQDDRHPIIERKPCVCVQPCPLLCCS
jgi:hypothetical protein